VTTRTDLAPPPAPFYAAKGALTRMRSLAWLLRGARVRDGLRILFYHRVADVDDPLAVHPDDFAEQMALLADTGYQGVDVLTAMTEPPPRAIGLSFDDGYLDVMENAVPALDRHGFTATVFLATGVTSGRARFRWYGDQPPLLSWDDVTLLDGAALRFEAHTVTHPDLRALGEEQAREEIAGSKRELEERLGHAVDVFCYPAGLYGARDVELVREAGFRFACSCEPGVNTPGTDPLQLRRIQVDTRDSLLDVRAKIAGAHDEPPAARTLWRRLRYGVSSRS
jgi:peptidoglycan/xylan/chitin deacetylase (PgdA/CDA1 family)